MGNAFRLFVFCLALTAVGLTAALGQLHVRHKARLRQHQSANKTDATAGRAAAFQAYQDDQQKSLILVVAVSFVCLFVVALAPVRRRDASKSGAESARNRGDMLQVEHLARVAVKNEDALRREREERRRSDENLHVQQLLLNQALSEKISLGRDLHDGVIQSLYATGLTFETSRQKRAEDPASADALFDRGLELLNANIREVRAYIHSLSQTGPAPRHGFSLALASLVEGIDGGRGAKFDIRVDEQAEARLSPAQMADVLQIVREASSNALRHGGATSIVVRLHENGDRLALLVQDDGAGFDPDKASSGGHGLANFKARAESLRADLRIDSRPGAGARVSLTFPTNPAA